MPQEIRFSMFTLKQIKYNHVSDEMSQRVILAQCRFINLEQRVDHGALLLFAALFLERVCRLLELIPNSNCGCKRLNWC